MTRIVILFVTGLLGLFPLAPTVRASNPLSPVASWLERLQSADAKIRTAAAYDLNIEAECPPAERALLLQALKNGTPFTRQYTAAALGDIRPPSEETTKALIAALADRDANVREQAAVSLSKIGPPAIPFLFDRLKVLPPDAYLKPNGEATGIAFALSISGDAIVEPLIAFLKQKPTGPRKTKMRSLASSEGLAPEFSSEREACAALIFGEIGMPAVRALVGLLNDKTKADFAVRALCRISPIETLARNWNSSEAEMREMSRRQIISSDGTVAGLFDGLTRELSHENPGVRLAAVNTLRAVGFNKTIPSATMKVLVTALSDSDQAVRREAAAILADFATVSNFPNSETKPLLDALTSADKPIRSSLIGALAAIGSREALPEIIKCIHDPECRSGGLAEAITTLAPDAPGVVEALIAALAEEGWDEPAAVRAVGAFGPAAKPAVDGLTKVMLKKVAPREAALILANAGSDGITALIKIVNDPGAPSDAKEEAAAALAMVAGKNPSIAEALKPLLSHPDETFRISVAKALATAGEIKAVRSFLQAKAKNRSAKDISEWRELIEVQVRVDPEAAAARLRTETTESSNIVSAIESCGTADENFVDPLLTQLSSKDKFARRDAARALGQFGPSRDRIIPRLLEKLTDVEDVRDACFESLAKLISDPSKADPLFRKVTNDKLVKSTISLFYDDLRELINPLPTPMAAGQGDLPPFPWPPPRYSSIGSFGKDFERKLLGDDETNLGAIYLRLYGAMKQCDSNFESGLFGTPGGFALLSKMERIASDGTPFPGQQRWVMGKIPPQGLSDLINQLFLEKPGFFRVIAFVVTDQINFGQGDEALPDLHRGGTDLPPGIAALPFKGRQCYALVYSLEKRPGTAVANLSREALNARVHLDKAGLLQALSATR